MIEFTTIAAPCEGSITEKRSEFIAQLFPAKNAEECVQIPAFYESRGFYGSRLSAAVPGSGKCRGYPARRQKDPVRAAASLRIYASGIRCVSVYQAISSGSGRSAQNTCGMRSRGRPGQSAGFRCIAPAGDRPEYRRRESRLL